MLMNTVSTGTINREALDFVRRIAYTAEYRKPDIKHHLERIRGYCSIIGRALDLSSQQVEIIAHASQLHDIGVAGIPDAIFTKTGDLSEHEWELVKRHPIIGAEILHGSPSPLLQAGELIALTHHERWDGSGYPYGIKGEEIPLSGRICALADVFDALTTPRLYKKEISFDEALQLIEDSGGQLFDPHLVEAFTKNAREIFKIRQTNLKS
jgi:putative two-component system response regulator